MKILKLDDRELEKILFEDSERFELVESDEWTQNGKCQYCDFIFLDTATNLHYKGFAGRSGSPFTDWTYNSELFDDVYELKPVEKIVKMVEVVEWVEQ